jgi:hypothetical protein
VKRKEEMHLIMETIQNYLQPALERRNVPLRKDDEEDEEDGDEIDDDLEVEDDDLDSNASVNGDNGTETEDVFELLDEDDDEDDEDSDDEDNDHEEVLLSKTNGDFKKADYYYTPGDQYDQNSVNFIEYMNNLGVASEKHECGINDISRAIPNIKLPYFSSYAYGDSNSFNFENSESENNLVPTEMTDNNNSLPTDEEDNESTVANNIDNNKKTSKKRKSRKEVGKKVPPIPTHLSEVATICPPPTKDNDTDDNDGIGSAMDGRIISKGGEKDTEEV